MCFSIQKIYFICIISAGKIFDRKDIPMKLKLINNSSEDLIIFLSGWGCDDNQFKDMRSAKNVLLCWDYSDINFDFDASAYKNVYLLAYSAGVFAAGLIKNKLPALKQKTAVNGNPLIFDDYYGIPKDVIKVFRGLNLSNYMDFRRDYLVAGEEELEDFNKNSSLRTFESCFEELDNLQKLAAREYPVMEFDKAIIAEKDKIFSPARQKEYFRGKYKTLSDCAHNVFYRFKNFDEILDF